MRPINADALAMHLADWQLSSGEEERDVIEEAIRAINEAPTIDAVPRKDYEELERHFVNWEPVVRCKDCKCWTEWANNTGSCSRFALDWIGTDADDFCSMGERKDDDKSCDTCKHYDKWWDDIICDGCTKAYSNWERKDDE